MFASCDTFVVLPSASSTGQMIFGKNSDRPQGEVQEVVFFPRQKFAPSSQQKCTYISVDAVPETYSTILSKPAWMFGAEMGANEHGVCVGNEAVWTRLASDSDLDGKLLGMDLVRLALERAKTASEALDVITSLLERYGQGGHCSDTMHELIYHNGFLIVDANEAWVLETAGSEWAAEKVESAFRNISNCLSVGTKIDKHSEKLKQTAIDKGFWDGNGVFDFAKVYADKSKGDTERLAHGTRLLKDYCSKDSKFSVKSMISILRDKDSRICRDCADAFPTASSQVSILSSSSKSVHWFTGTPDPQYSYFKPFIFHPKVTEASDKTKSPTEGSDRKHVLYKRHELFYERLRNDAELQKTLLEIESMCIDELMEQVIRGPSESDEIHCLFSDSVESELRFYR